MFRALFLWAVCIFLASGYDPCAGQSTLTIKVNPTKSTFVEGEPVELTVTIFNNGKNVRIYMNYPTFRAFDSSGVTFKIVTAPSEVKVTPLDDSEHRVPIIEVAAGQEWITRIYLQRFLSNLTPGRYRISYKVELRHDTKMPSPNSDISSSEGELSFTIVAADQQQLKESLSQYSAKLESQDFWERRAAMEALSLVEDPVVIPHLGVMVRLGMADYGLRALARFSKNEEAQSIVLNSLTSKQASAVVQALTVLAGWAYKVNTNDLQILLKRDNLQIKIAALRYVKSIGDKGYVEVIKPYLNDPDPNVSKEAQKAQGILQKPGN